MIHSSAHIDASAEIDEGVSIGPYSVIGPNVKIKSGTVIEGNAFVHKNTYIGKDNLIYPFASVGGDPQDLKYQGEDTFLEIGDLNEIREGSTINRGTVQENGKTVIGNNNLLMAYTHVAHDCILEDDIVMTNNAGVAGVVKVGRGARLSGFTLVHQFCHIGSYSFSALGTIITKDVPAYVRVSGNPAIPRGLNTVGIQRQNLSKEAMDALKESYKILYLRKNKLKDAKLEIISKFKNIKEMDLFIESISNSERSIVR
ncbi:MAG: acyl-ACP--UDP-N-acetylglucosamine O-acyltransferase [SAR86 cluster bacterium]|uniref:Acyl-ACP--UDP-N-acetylglucosamine O-acyltransferase n=1 Tax=SAR86 cluster bacterium TaxID=2030880 RepID=A0A937I1R6_9GAMM|nr:acyl-ACP--UDP-N-acetylglucosamine O-acyltransferase [SAR86 cluster bacterium]